MTELEHFVCVRQRKKHRRDQSVDMTFEFDIFYSALKVQMGLSALEISCELE